MKMEIDVQKEVFFPAEKNHVLWALNTSYTNNNGCGMILCMHDTDTKGKGVSSWEEWISSTQVFNSEDNGKTWMPQGEKLVNGSLKNGKLHNGDRQFFLDPEKNKLISIYNVSELNDPNAEGIVWNRRRNRFYYDISDDGGKSWQGPWQIVHPNELFDDINWMPGIIAGSQNACADQGPFLKLDDGTIIFGFHIVYSETNTFKTAFLRGRWNSSEQISWSISETVEVPESVSTIGAGEPDLLYLGAGKIVTTLRCPGNQKKHIYSSRQMSISEDGGMTWKFPEQLRYDDGSPVHVPASLARFTKNSKSGKAYWIANIIDDPVCGADPRYPLSIAEFDTNNLCVIKNSVTPVIELAKGAPIYNESSNIPGKRFSNFAHYIDRESGDLILLIPDEPKTNWDKVSADSLKITIKID